MDSFVSFAWDFYKYSVIMNFILVTVKGLITSSYKAFFMSEEEFVEKEKKRQAKRKEIDLEIDKLSSDADGDKEILNSGMDWLEEHEVKRIFVLYGLCLIPIVNVIIFFTNLEITFEAVIKKFNSMFTN